MLSRNEEHRVYGRAPDYPRLVLVYADGFIDALPAPQTKRCTEEFRATVTRSGAVIDAALLTAVGVLQINGFSQMYPKRVEPEDTIVCTIVAS